MTLILDHGRARERSSALSRFVVAPLRGLARLVAHEIDRRRTMALLELDDRLLTDIGVSRGDVHAALTGASGEKPSEHLAETRRLAWLGRRAQIREARATRWMNDE